MIVIADKIKCTGCAACYHICSENCIRMIPNEEGFLYPSVDEDKCIHCGRCDEVCPLHNNVNPSKDLRHCLAAYNTLRDDRSISSSGGIFIAMAKLILSQNGVVYGAAFDKNFQVYHKRIEAEEQLPSIVGSKYLQSKVGKIYFDIENDLQKARTVLFSGTGCQIGGLKSYLQKDYPNLFCVDFICLGVPSPQIWKDYLKSNFDTNKIRYINFKDKSRGWHDFSLRIESEENMFCESGKINSFFQGYFKGLYSRPSCSDCFYKKINRVSDITISDCWGYLKIAPEMDDNQGLSSVVIHSPKGELLFEKIKDVLAWKEASIEDVEKYNNNYCVSRPMGKDRDAFWETYRKCSCDEAFEKYC